MNPSPFSLRSADDYRCLLEAAPDGFVVVDLAGTIVYANARMSDLFGYSTERLIGERIELLVPDNLRERHRAHRERYASQPYRRPMGADLELLARRKDGSDFPVSITLSPLNLDCRDFVSATIRDLTDLHFARLRIRYAERQRVVSEMGALFLQQDDIGQTMKQAAELVSRELGTEFVSIVETHRGTGARIIRMEHGWRDSQVGIVRRDDQRSPAWHAMTERHAIVREEWASDPTIDMSGRPATHGVVGGLAVPMIGRGGPLGAIGAYSATRRTYSDADVSFVESLANLIGAAIERKRTNEIMKQSHHLEALGQLASGVAHDFSNVLTAVIGALEQLDARYSQDCDTAQIVRGALTAAVRGGELSHRLLALSRHENLAPQPVDVNARLRSMAGVLRRTFGERYTVDLRLADQLPPALVDPSELENVLLNLGINARDAMPAGGRVSIETSVHTLVDEYDPVRRLKRGTYLVISITDSGIGMSPEVLARAMEPFFTTKPDGKGTGLGLSLAHAFASQSGGSLTLYSEPRLGTTARLFLPASEVKTLAASVASQKPLERGCEHVLVVEDDDAVRSIAVRLLRSLGYEVCEAGDPATALAIIASGIQIDLLFTDVVLGPGMSGPALAGEVARRYPPIKLLFASGYGDVIPTAADECRTDAPVVTKPYTKGDLARWVRAVLDGRPFAPG